MDIKSSAFIFLAAAHVLTCVGTTGEEWYKLIPANFLDKDIAQYTVRYVNSDGNDTGECLQNQPYPQNGSGSCLQDNEIPVTYCRTIGYSMLGECAGLSVNCTANITSNLIILFSPGTYMYGDKEIVLSYYSNIVIRKIPGCVNEVVFSCSELSETTYNNIYIRYAKNIGIDGIIFSNCGPKSPSVAMLLVSNATITNCIFRDNYCNLVYNQTNSLVSRIERYAGGLTMIWRDQTSLNTVFIKNCTFMNNTAAINDRNLDDIEIRPNLYTPRGHGGAISASFNMTNNHTLIIEDSVIADNSAKFNGGGLFLSFYNRSNTNKIIINRTLFEGNICNITGGAISMNTFEVANRNHLIVHNSSFVKNKAWVGGGACTINLQDNQIANSDTPVVSNIGVFENCTFRDNYSPTGGSTVSLVSNTRVDQATATTNFTNCNFINNEAYLNGDGALMGFRFPISLLGYNYFGGNVGGGVSLLQSRLDSYGHVLFEDNISHRGGGMELKDISLIQLFNGTRMTFINNIAMTQGGALSTSETIAAIDSEIIRLFNFRCFFQYEIGTVSGSLPPSEWNVNIIFINNTASDNGGAIYATDIDRCTYTGELNASLKVNTYERSIFKLPIFYFEGSNVTDPVTSRMVKDVATAPSWFRVEPQMIKGAPGEIVPLYISTVDESGNWEEAIYNTNDDDENENYYSLKAGGQFYNYKICERRSEACLTENQTALVFSIVQIMSGSVRNTTEVKVTVIDCYPGYYLSGNVCKLNRTDLILRPDRANHYVYIKPQYYADYHNDTKVIVYAVIPVPFHKCRRDNGLTGCLFEYDQPEKQCTENRTGFLCGSCPEKHGVDLTLTQCRVCSVKDTILVIIIIVLFVVGCALVLIFNIGIPNELRGCLFFYQVVGLVYQYRADDTSASWVFHLSRVFGSSLYLTLCPLPGTNALYTNSYGFILPVLAIFTILVYILSARFIRKLSNKNSFDGIWLLTFIIYKFIADTCFSILRCQKVVGEGLGSEYVYYYDGTFKCFTLDDLSHLCFALVALILGTIVMLFPALILLISFKRLKMTQQLTDVLNKDIKVSCRWWGGFDLFRRLLFILVVLIFNYHVPLYTQLALLFAGLFVFFCFACAQPYNSKRANLIEVLILLDLLVLTALFLNTTTQNQNSVKPYAETLLLIPFLSMGIYIGYAIFRLLWGKWAPKKIKVLFSKLKDAIHLLTPEETENVILTDEFSNGFESEPEMENMDLNVNYSAFREELLEDY